MARNTQQSGESLAKRRIGETMALLEGGEKKIAIIRHAERPNFSSLENESQLGNYLQRKKSSNSTW
jgi:hypothetical protein